MSNIVTSPPSPLDRPLRESKIFDNNFSSNNQTRTGISDALLCPDVLQLVGRVEEVVCVGLWCELSRVGLLDKVLVALLLGEMDGILLGLEVDVCSLHEISRRLPSDQRVLPSVSLGQDVPIHSPALAPEVARLCSGLGLLVDANVCVRKDVDRVRRGGRRSN